MIKMISIFSLPEDTDLEGFWKYWNEIHVPEIKKLKGIRKYIIHRVKKRLAGEEIFWGLVETWWNSEEEMRKAFGSPEGQKAAGDFWSRVIGRSSVLVEENEII